MPATAKLIWLACISGLTMFALQAQQPKLPEPYQEIFDLAHATPPEFAAEALLEIEESGKIAARESRLTLIDEAFRLAATAQYRIPFRAIPGADTDSRPAFLNQAYRLRLDALSLQTRAVRDMLGVDKAKARALFAEIAVPALQPLTCDDVLIPEVSALYQTLGTVAGSTFSEKERAKEEHVNFLLGYLARVNSPAQLAPVAGLIKSVDITPDQRSVLVARFNAILENMPADDRSFSATLGALEHEITPEFSAAFEKYSQRGTAGTRCKDNLGPAAKLTIGGASPNNEGSPKIVRYWDSESSRRIFQEAQKLRFSASGAMYSSADRASDEWNRRLTDFLKDLADWGPADEKSETDFYHEKCLVFESLADLVPAGEQRRSVFEAFIAFLTGSNLQQQSPAEWFVHARSLYDRVKNMDAAEAAKLLDRYRASGNPVLVLFAAMQSAFGSKAPSWTGLTGD